MSAPSPQSRRRQRPPPRSDAGQPRGLVRVTPAARMWGTLTLVIFHAVFIVLATVCAPVLVWRIVFDRRYRTGLPDRFGLVPKSPAHSRCVWIHGVSVGEVKGAATLIARIRAEHPDLDIVVSTTTATGQELARRLYPQSRVVYYPLDFGLFPGRALDRIRPRAVLLMELEIWPNFLQAAMRRGVPVAVINGRISARSFRGYRLVRPLIPQFGFIGLYCVQDDSYRERLLALGVPSERIVVTGNMKYDGVLVRRVPSESASLREWLADGGHQVLVCGSTHGREDEWLAAAVDRMSRTHPIRLVTVPRHPERSGAVVEALAGLGFDAVRWSGCDASALEPLGDRDVVVVDTIGHLESFYGACDVAFVGGSLVPHGGQNMLEPAALGKAVVFGPYTDNFRTDVDLLLGAGAAVRVGSHEQLEVELLRLFGDPAERERLADRAVSVITGNQGATERTLRLVEPIMA